MVIEWDIKSVCSLIMNSSNESLIVVAPNYEERSLAALGRLIQSMAAGKTSSVLFAVFTFIGRHLSGLLESLRADSTRQAVEILRQNGYRVRQFTHEYPPRDREVFRTNLESCFRDLNQGRPINVLIDISCLPKVVLLALLRGLSELLTVTSLKVGEVFALYTWADDYPLSPGAVGRPYCYFSGVSLDEQIQGREDVVLVIFPSPQGFEGKSVYDAVPNARSFILVFMNRHDPLRSLRTMRMNPSLLERSGRSPNTEVKYYFTLTNGMERLRSIFMEEYIRVVSRDASRSSSIFLLAPFGPKPLVVASFLAVNYMRKQGMAADIILLSSFQHTSIYSYGVGRTSAFSIPETMLKGEEI